jgi:tetratricopeptide (TPR) repeat protein
LRKGIARVPPTVNSDEPVFSFFIGVHEMKRNAIRIILALGCALSSIGIHAQGKAISPPNLELQAKDTKVRSLVDRAEQLKSKGKIDAAAKTLKEAIAIERTYAYPNFLTGVASRLARMLVSAGRDEEAVAAYRQCFAWDIRRGDLEGHPENAVGFALLLSKLGKVEEAKAMYYWVLRNFNGGRGYDGVWNLNGLRFFEPVPFLVVFDPDPDAVVWEYTPDRFRAAVLMVSQFGSADPKAIDEIRKLAPDWFWPIVYLADKTDPIRDETYTSNAAKRSALISQADSLARPGLEQELMGWYHHLIKEAPSAMRDYKPGTVEHRPMTEGNRRRALIAVLKPNEALLKKLSVPFPNVPTK